MRHAAAIRAGRLYSVLQKPVLWSPHEDCSCFACDAYSKGLRGGRNPAKRAKCEGRPRQSSYRALEFFLNSLAPPSLKGSTSQAIYPNVADKDSDVLKELICQICNDVVDRPIATSCNHIFCMRCLVDQYKGLDAENEWTCSIENCGKLFRKGTSKSSFKDMGAFASPHQLVYASLRSIKVNVLL